MYPFILNVVFFVEPGDVGGGVEESVCEGAFSHGGDAVVEPVEHAAFSGRRAIGGGTMGAVHVFDDVELSE